MSLVVTEKIRTSAGSCLQPSLAVCARFWWKFGWISFGGTAAHLAIMHRELVERRGWIGSEEFFHALNYCMLLPGPEAQQLAIYIGWKLHNKVGGVVAGTLFVLPSVVILLALSLVYAQYGTSPIVGSVFGLLKPLVLLLVLRALLQIGKRAIHTKFQVVIVACALFMLMVLHLSLPLTLGGGVVLGVGKTAFRKKMHDPGLLCGDVRRSFAWGPYSTSALRTLATCAGIAASPLLALYWVGLPMHFWLQLSGFFTRTAVVTLGGSYTVVPYVAQMAVSKYGWLTRAQMLDGFALAETTPGPLIIVVAFVGFIAGVHTFHGSLLMGSLALVLTCLYTFLPCFFMVFMGAPWVRCSQGHASVNSVLDAVGSVVIAAILQLTLFLTQGVLFRRDALDWHALNEQAVAELTVVLLIVFVFKLFARRHKRKQDSAPVRS